MIDDRWLFAHLSFAFVHYRYRIVQLNAMQQNLNNTESIRREIWSILENRSVFRKFWERKNRMCACGILRKFSWKFWCVLVHITYPGKFICVLVLFLKRCSYKRVMSSWKIHVFLNTSKPPVKFDVF